MIKLKAIKCAGVLFAQEPADGWYVESYRDDQRNDHWRVVRHDYDGSILPGYPRFFATRADAEMLINLVVDSERTGK